MGLRFRFKVFSGLTQVIVGRFDQKAMVLLHIMRSESCGSERQITYLLIAFKVTTQVLGRTIRVANL
jgi:hypothetical protein